VAVLVKAGLLMRQYPLSRFLARMACLLSAGVSLAPGLAHATEGDFLRPFVEASMGYDSNLFRFTNDAQALASSLAAPIQGITYQRYGAGLDVDWKQGRQLVTGHIATNQTRFSRYATLLDNTGQDLSGNWNWQLGNHWSGVLSATQNKSLAPYTNQFTGTIDNNVVTNDNRTFQANYGFHSNWSGRLQLDHAEHVYSSSLRSFSNSNTTTTTLGLYHLGKVIDRLGVELVDLEGEFPNRPVPNALGNRFKEQSFRIAGNWAVSGKSSLSGYIGYAQRSYPEAGQRNYDGMQWRLVGTWLPTGKSQLGATLYRELRDWESTTINYVSADGINLSAAWQVLPKTRIIVQGSNEQISYVGISGHEQETILSLSANYEAWRGGDIAAGLQRSWRRADDVTREYDSSMLFVSTNLKF
jgi:hypothetical protein